MLEEDILSTVLVAISKGSRHEHYEKTCDLRKYWTSVVTGEGQESIILKKRGSLTDTQKNEAIRLFNTHTPLLANRIRSVFKEVDRTKPTVKALERNSESQIKDSVWNDFLEQFSDFHQGQSLDSYLEERLYDASAMGGNDYLLIDFFPFDSKTQSPEIYPIVYSCEDVILKNEDHKGLEYIVFRRSTEIQSEGVRIVGHDKKPVKQSNSVHYDYFLYTRNYSYHIILAEAAEKTSTSVKDYEAFSIDKDTLYYKQTKHLSGNVPAIRLGYFSDVTTAYETNASHLTPARQVIDEHCEKKSKLDNQMALFGFIRALFYVQPCNNKDEDGNVCEKGLLGRKECGACGGSGLGERKSRVARNEFEITEYEMPLPSRNPQDIDLLDLSKLSHFVEIPTAILDLYEKQVDKLSLLTSLALFNANVFDQSELNSINTATGVRQFAKSVNNVIFEYAQFKARVWKFIAGQASHYYGIKKEINYELSYSSDFKLETDHEVIKLIQDGKNANLSMDYIRSQERVLMEKQYKENPIELKWFSEKIKWKPFYNKSESEVLTAIGMLGQDHDKKILWLHFEDIFNDIRYADKLPEMTDGKRFPDLDYEAQKKVIKHYVDIYKKDIPSDVIDFPITE